MPQLEIGVVTDEISRDLGESLDLCRDWGLRRIELREGGEARFPGFTDEEFAAVEQAVNDGFKVTAVSPGIFKCHADDESTIRDEYENTLARSIDVAYQLGCSIIISFGFERYAGESPRNRIRAMRALELAANRAWDADMVLAVENEPDFWVDDAIDQAEMFNEIQHPGLRANWDPANSHWGGHIPTREGFEALRSFIANVHVKDFTPDDPNVPWRPVGQGETPWADFLPWIIKETDVEHVTIETHAPPLIENTRQSLEALRKLLS